MRRERRTLIWNEEEEKGANMGWGGIEGCILVIKRDSNDKQNKRYAKINKCHHRW